MSTGGYAVTAKVPRIRATNRIKKAKIPMKLTLRQKLRNWLMNDSDDYCESIAVDDCAISLASNGFRLNIYGASGGTIIETTKYDRKNDENRHSLHVVTDDKNLGEEISKIITMENLR